MTSTMNPFKPAQSARRTVRVTGRKYAATAPRQVHEAFGLEPRDWVRPIVAALSSKGNTADLVDMFTVFLENMEDLRGVLVEPAELPGILDRIIKALRHRGVSQVARPLAIQRLRSPEPIEHHGFPLRRTQLVVLNRQKGCIIAELKEVSRILDLRGMGTDEDAALRDLERRFDQLVREKVRIPPHARRVQDDAVRDVVNHLVDWDQFARENPPSRLLWGKIEKVTPSGLPVIHWLASPEGLRDCSAVLPHKYWTPYFALLHQGDWFRGAARDYIDRVEWDEPPTCSPDPMDPKNRQAAWDAIPRIEANDPDAWPLKRK